MRFILKIVNKISAVYILVGFLLVFAGCSPADTSRVPEETNTSAASPTAANIPPLTDAPTRQPTIEPTNTIRPEPEGPALVFEQTFGGENIDRGVSVYQTEDGGFIISGVTTSFGDGDEDVFLVRTAADGSEIWSQTYGGEGDDSGWSVLETDNGDFIIAGFTNSFGSGAMDIYLLRTNASGELLWEKTFGGLEDDFAWAIIKAEQGGYLIAGETDSIGQGETDAYFLRIDEQGELIWAQSYGHERTDRIFSVDQSPNGGFIAAGTSTSFNGRDRDAYVIKTDTEGNLEWEMVFGEEDDDVAHAVHVTADEGFLLTGYTRSFDASDYDAYLIKLDAGGNQEWDQVFGGRSDDRLITGRATSDGGSILVGYTKSFGAGNWDVYLVRVDHMGHQVWLKALGGTGEDTGYTVQQTSDGGYVLTGYTRSKGAGLRDMLLIKLAAEE